MNGEIPSLIQEGNYKAAETRTLWHQRILGKNNFFLELQDHGGKDEYRINQMLIEISKCTGIPLAAANEVCYLEKEDAQAHGVLLCIAQNKTIKECERNHFETNEFYFKNGDEMSAMFKDYPEAIANTVQIAKRCNVAIPPVKTKDLPRYLPEFEIPDGYSSSKDYLQNLTLKGLEKRYPGNDSAKKRAKYELAIINEKGFSDYFLIVADYVNWAKEQGIPVGPGRGSAPSSIVSYALGITGIDPIRYNLPFERFINPDQESIPYFYLDFSGESRDMIIDYITAKYGNNRVGKIVIFGIFRARDALRAAGEALNMVSESETLINLLPDPAWRSTFTDALDIDPKLRDVERDSRYRELFSVVRKIEGRKRYISIHDAGRVIVKADLINYVPLYCDSSTGSIASQYASCNLEDFGLIKFDFLGLKTLDILKRAEARIRKRGNAYSDFSTANIPPDDITTYTLLQRGDTQGVFQFESDDIKEILQQFKPGCLMDIALLYACYRPGLMEYLTLIINRKRGIQPVEYPYPVLKDTLKETYGVIVYQEQVMQIIHSVTGYSPGKADMLRRSLRKKNPAYLEAEKGHFISDAVKHGFIAQTADDLFSVLVSTERHTFNKSHAVAYALIAYQTAYLKANFQEEFSKALLPSGSE
jgi:DNA polymerase-3 subunit alpha